MDQMTLLYVMAGFVIVSAIALCIQAGTLFGMYMATKKLQEKVEPLIPKLDAMIPKVNSIVETAKVTVEQGQKQIAEITTKANDILESAKSQVHTVGDVVTDAAGRAKVQMQRVELILDDTMSRTHETVATVHNRIMKPLREINGIAVGVRTAINHLAKGGRPSVAQATSDEEMFI